MSDTEPCWKVFKEYWEFGFRFLPGKSATATCAKTFITYPLQKSCFSCSGGQCTQDWWFLLS